MIRRTTVLAAAALAALSASTAAAQPAAMTSDAKEYLSMIAPAESFLSLIVNKYPGRDCVRDRGLLNDEQDKVMLSLLQLFAIRDDLRPDVREAAMRLATFQPLPAESRGQIFPLAFPPTTENEKALNTAVVEARKRIWAKLDEIEAKMPSAAVKAGEKRVGLILGLHDRGWRPESPTAIPPERSNCESA